MGQTGEKICFRDGMILVTSPPASRQQPGWVLELLISPASVFEEFPGEGARLALLVASSVINGHTHTQKPSIAEGWASLQEEERPLLQITGGLKSCAGRDSTLDICTGFLCSLISPPFCLHCFARLHFSKFRLFLVGENQGENNWGCWMCHQGPLLPAAITL